MAEFEIGVFAVVRNAEGQVLLSHRRDMGIWNLPGGGLERNESPWDGVLREIEEETGLVCKVDRLIGVYTKESKDLIVFCFSCAMVQGRLTPTGEADRHAFFRLDQLPSRLSPNQRERIFDAFRNEELVLRRQTGPSTADFLKSLSDEDRPGI